MLGEWTKGVIGVTDFLFAMPDFLREMGRTIDIGSTLVNYNSSETPGEADSKALANDWAVIGTEWRKS
jgi:hypothetical protein